MSKQTYGITAFGGHVPRLRMLRSAISDAHRWMTGSTGSAKGQRAFCSWDEDSVTMAAEALRDALHASDVSRDQSISLATPLAPFDDLQCASIVASANSLRPKARANDLAHSQRWRSGIVGRASRKGRTSSSPSQVRRPGMCLVASMTEMALIPVRSMGSEVLRPSHWCVWLAHGVRGCTANCSDGLRDVRSTTPQPQLALDPQLGVPHQGFAAISILGLH